MNTNANGGNASRLTETVQRSPTKTLREVAQEEESCQLDLCLNSIRNTQHGGFNHSRRRRYNPGYDTELPEQARLELDRPRRPRILGRKTKSTLKKSPKWPLYLALHITIVVVGGTMATWRQEPTAERTNKAISQLLVPQPAPTPMTPAPGRASRWTLYLATQQTPAPRATLVKLPPPRAQLVGDLSPLIPGKRYLATMPYDNLEVLATFRGWLPSQDDLPSHPNAIGDMYLVGNVPFVWLFAPDATHADWIDP